jgi:hypothetical protein
LEAEKADQLKALDEDILKKIKTIPKKKRAHLMNLYTEARFKSFGLLQDEIVRLDDAKAHTGTMSIMKGLL